MKLRRLSAEAIAELGDSITAVRSGEAEQEALTALIESLIASAREVGPELSDERPLFSSRLELGEFLHADLARVSADLLEDRGVWTWLALTHFDALCPSGVPGEEARYILSEDRQRYYRHLLYGPYLAVSAHPGEHDALKVLLGNPVDAPGEIWAQIAGRQAFIASTPIVRALGRVYYDRSTDSAKSGAAGSGPGSVRRFVKVLDQLDCTWDLWEVPLEVLVEMLPREFDRYLDER